MITLITGGIRSGKSAFAEQMVRQACKHPIYLATSTVQDEEMRLRVQRHRERRGSEWSTVEEPLHLSQHDFSGRTVLLDCVTLWATNAFFHFNEVVEEALQFISTEIEALSMQSADFYMVTNEVGLGGISNNAMARQFADLQGWTNQLIAQRAENVWLVACGIPVKIK